MGHVRVDRSATGYPNFTYRPKDWKKDLPLMQASSMVSELAPVVLYLRHVVRRGDLLIIEEPESHLHRHDRDRLRYKKINLRGQKRQTVLLRCGDKLVKALS